MQDYELLALAARKNSQAAMDAATAVVQRQARMRGREFHPSW